VDEVMQRWPAAIRVFLDFRMACAGCPIAGFHTIADACREHRLGPDVVLTELRGACAPPDDVGSPVGLRWLGYSK